MNTEGVLSEGWFDSIKKGLGKLALNRAEKKAWKTAEKSGAEFEKSLRAFAKSLGTDYETIQDDIKKIMKSS